MGEITVALDYNAFAVHQRLNVCTCIEGKFMDYGISDKKAPGAFSEKVTLRELSDC